MRKVWIMLLCVVGALACFWALRTLYIVNYAPMRAFEDAAAPTPTQRPPRTGETPAPTLPPEERLLLQADQGFMKDRVNILLVGFDESPERDDEDSEVYRTDRNNFRSDVLLLLAVNFGKDTVRLISIPRDTYAEIYHTRGRWKINAAFAKGGAAKGQGFTYAMKTVELLMGVPVTHYAGVNMEGLKALVDALGGVDYDVDVEIHLNGRTLEKGVQHLDGQQVLDYCRARKGISTDLGRNDRQQRMLLAVFNEMKNRNQLALLPQLYGAVKDDVYTNLTVAQIAALAAFALRLDEDSFTRTTLPGEYVSNVYNASYYVLKNKELSKLIKEEFGVSVKRSSRYDLATVKRDKAAAEARRAAEQMERAAAELTVPADTTGSKTALLLKEVRGSAKLLLDAIAAETTETEINRLRELLYRDMAALYRENGDMPLPEAFAALAG